METPKDDSFDKKAISRVTEPIQLQLSDGAENSSYALLGSECSSSEEKSLEVLVPETPLQPKKTGVSNRNSSPLKEIQQNFISSGSPPVGVEKLSPVKTTLPGPIPLREFASPLKENQGSSEDPFASLDESSFHSCDENTPPKSKKSTESNTKS